MCAHTYATHVPQVGPIFERAKILHAKYTRKVLSGFKSFRFLSGIQTPKFLEHFVSLYKKYLIEVEIAYRSNKKWVKQTSQILNRLQKTLSVKGKEFEAAVDKVKKLDATGPKITLLYNRIEGRKKAEKRYEKVVSPSLWPEAITRWAIETDDVAALYSKLDVICCAQWSLADVLSYQDTQLGVFISGESVPVR